MTMHGTFKFALINREYKSIISVFFTQKFLYSN